MRIDKCLVDSLGQIVFDSKLLLSPGAYPGDDIIAGLCFPVLRVGMDQGLSFSIDSK